MHLYFFGEYQSICRELLCSATEAELEGLIWVCDSVMMFSEVAAVFTVIGREGGATLWRFLRRHQAAGGRS